VRFFQEDTRSLEVIKDSIQAKVDKISAFENIFGQSSQAHFQKIREQPLTHFPNFKIILLNVEKILLETLNYLSLLEKQPNNYSQQFKQLKLIRASNLHLDESLLTSAEKMASTIDRMLNLKTILAGLVGGIIGAVASTAAGFITGGPAGALLVGVIAVLPSVLLGFFWSFNYFKMDSIEKIVRNAQGDAILAQDGKTDFLREANASALKFLKSQHLDIDNRIDLLEKCWTIVFAGKP
jgi:hypothetical protein